MSRNSSTFGARLILGICKDSVALGFTNAALWRPDACIRQGASQNIAAATSLREGTKSDNFERRSLPECMTTTHVWNEQNVDQRMELHNLDWVDCTVSLANTTLGGIEIAGWSRTG